MAHTKAKGSSKNNRDSQSKRLGVKLYGGEVVKKGMIIVRQRGSKYFTGEGVMVEDEGCLSVPGVFARVKRFARVRLRAVDAHGEPFELEATGLLAKAFQHEVDHLDGKLFIDRLPFTEKLRVLSLIKDLRRDWT